MKILNKHVSSQLVQDFRTVLESDMQKEETLQRILKLKHNSTVERSWKERENKRLEEQKVRKNRREEDVENKNK